jgi:hypothetical protein
MYLHNTTFKVALLHNNDFVFHIKEKVIPQLKNEMELTEIFLLELLNIDIEDGKTYCLHIVFKDLENFNHYKLFKENKILSEIFDQYKEDVLFFSSVLKRIG